LRKAYRRRFCYLLAVDRSNGNPKMIIVLNAVALAVTVVSCCCCCCLHYIMDVKQLEDILRTIVLAYILDDDVAFASLCATSLYYSSLIINHLTTERGSCNHRQKQRKTWNEYADPIDDGSFRRMFRMTKSSFQKLCDIIENAVGEKNSNPKNI